MIVCVKRRDGSRVWLRANGVLSLYSGGIKAVSYIFVDVTEVNEARQRIAVDEERYRMMADISDEYIFEYTHSTDTIAFAEKYIKDFDSSAVVKNFRAKLHTRSTIYKDDVRIIKKILEAAKKAKKKLTFEVRLVDKHNSVQWHRFVCKTIFDESGNPYKTIGKFVNIDSEKKEREVLKLQAQTDPLTKLYNRTQFEETVCRYLLNASPGTMYALLIIDIDGFKEANDKMGHLMGDRLLMEVAKTLKEAFGAKDIVSRLGGDEFIVFISDVSSHVEVEKRAEVLCRSLNKEYKNKSCTYNMSVSIGGVVTDGAVDFSGLYKDADQALYTAKNSGKNRHVIIKNFKREELT